MTGFSAELQLSCLQTVAESVGSYSTVAQGNGFEFSLVG